MIREATLEDVEHVVEYGGRFHRASLWADVAFDSMATRGFIERLIAGDDSAVFVSPRGIIGGLLTPLYFNPRQMLAVETFWYAEDGAGMELRRLFEEWAEARGAIPQFSALADSHEPAMRRVMRRAGYAPSEIAFVRR